MNCPRALDSSSDRVFGAAALTGGNMAIEGVHPDLQEVAFALYLADLDYEENKGNSRLGPELLEKAKEAQLNYREAKAVLEKKLGHPV